jgi:HrpA-like RNA helicase
MSKACSVRPEFKAIVMSSTIDVNVFARKMIEFGPDSCPVIPRVTYPIEVHFCDTHALRCQPRSPKCRRSALQQAGGGEEEKEEEGGGRFIQGNSDE